MYSKKKYQSFEDIEESMQFNSQGINMEEDSIPYQNKTMTEGSILESFAEELVFDGSGQKFSDQEQSIQEDSFQFDDEPLSFTEPSKNKTKKLSGKKSVLFKS